MSGCDWDKCKTEPIWHLVWMPSRENAILCEKHRKKAFRYHGRPTFIHEVDAPCGRPGSKFDTEANRCLMPPPPSTEKEKAEDWIRERFRDRDLVGVSASWTPFPV